MVGGSRLSLKEVRVGSHQVRVYKKIVDRVMDLVSKDSTLDLSDDALCSIKNNWLLRLSKSPALNPGVAVCSGYGRTLDTEKLMNMHMPKGPKTEYLMRKQQPYIVTESNVNVTVENKSGEKRALSGPAAHAAITFKSAFEFQNENPVAVKREQSRMAAYQPVDIRTKKSKDENIDIDQFQLDGNNSDDLNNKDDSLEDDDDISDVSDEDAAFELDEASDESETGLSEGEFDVNAVAESNVAKNDDTENYGGINLKDPSFYMNEQPEQLVEDDPLNSADDLSENSNQEIIPTDNIIICQYDKIVRSKYRWKLELNCGIANLNGIDYVFNKATGDAEW